VSHHILTLLGLAVESLIPGVSLIGSVFILFGEGRE
jgi:hypothetical protein